uniref:DNA (cytosine-5-)-methyltransferase n=1 Tax=Brassica campestris TaxID=3711 RepID=M4DTL4_BRACM
MKRPEPSTDLSFTGEPISAEEAIAKWPSRYRSSKARVSATVGTPKDGEENLEQAKRHYSQALVDGTLFNLGDDVYVKAEDGNPNYIAKIVEFFEAIDGEPYFRARWFYRPEDTVIKTLASEVQEKRVFLSNVEDDNPLNCIVSRVNIVKVPAKIVSGAEERVIPPCDFYYDMKYELAHLTFSTAADDGDASSTISSESDSNCIQIPQQKEKFLLDLYSGCGAMSTGLCMGASLSGVKLIKVRNEAAEDFLKLLIEWRKLCQKFGLISTTEVIESDGDSEDEEEDGDENDDADGDSNGSDIPPEEFEVDKFLDICFGNPNGLKAESAFHLKVRWKGYGPDEDTWEPFDGLRKCKDKLKEFVTTGFNTNRFPLPGDVHFVCGGPPCQGISGFNRFRNNKAPLEDEKNRQLLVYMDIIDYLKPNYVLMENVVDLLRFSKGFCARYAVARLVAMNYQTRLGMMTAGSYGVPQVRNRVFLWGAQPTEATNYEKTDERKYDTRPQTNFQNFIRLSRAESIIPLDGGDASKSRILYDHQPLELNDDDLERVCHIVKKKGANFRDLPGVIVDEDNKVKFDPSVERPKLKSGKFLVPDYAVSFVNGKSKKPFGRLWWDEIVHTVVTRAEPHNQIVIHPLQDRVLTVRENARIQGFPDFYKLCGPIKEKYIQVGNAVAVPVGVALGYAFGLASQGLTDNQPVIKLPFQYPQCMQGKTEEHSA